MRIAKVAHTHHICFGRRCLCATNLCGRPLSCRSPTTRHDWVHTDDALTLARSMHEDYHYRPAVAPCDIILRFLRHGNYSSRESFDPAGDEGVDVFPCLLFPPRRLRNSPPLGAAGTASPICGEAKGEVIGELKGDRPSGVEFRPRPRPGNPAPPPMPPKGPPPPLPLSGPMPRPIPPRGRNRPRLPPPPSPPPAAPPMEPSGARAARGDGGVRLPMLCVPSRVSGESYPGACAALRPRPRACVPPALPTKPCCCCPKGALVVSFATPTSSTRPSASSSSDRTSSISSKPPSDSDSGLPPPPSETGLSCRAALVSMSWASRSASVTASRRCRTTGLRDVGVCKGPQSAASKSSCRTCNEAAGSEQCARCQQARPAIGRGG